MSLTEDHSVVPESIDKIGNLAFEQALKLFQEAAQRVPAYKDFLKKAGINSEKVRTADEFAQLPLVEKENYLSQYSLDEMSWDGCLDTAKYISTSSGSTGEPFFWPVGHDQEVKSGILLKNLYENVYSTREGRTLYVSSLAFGTWIAGFEHYNATRWVAEHQNPITLVMPGIDKAEAIKQIKKLAPLFDRVILVGYPPFIKDILDLGRESGVEWKKIDIHFLTMGDSMSDLWRERVLDMVGKKNSLTTLINLYGMADAGGAIAYETPVTLTARKLLQEKGVVEGLPTFSSIIGLFQYYPTYHYLEEVNGTLVMTTNAGLPLIRYSTRDNGGVLGFNEMTNRLGNQFFKRIDDHKIDITPWQLPFVYLQGRRDLSILFYALNIYIENVRTALESTLLSNQLSGIFIMSVNQNNSLDQELLFTIELSQGINPSPELTKNLTEEVAEQLSRVNSEYAKLHSELGERADPKIILVPFGKIDTIPGKKHKWVKRT